MSQQHTQPASQQKAQEQTPAQTPPGTEAKLVPKADHGESSYVGHGRLADKKAIVTGADSGIGRAVALAFAREGADVLIAYLDEHEDAQETGRLVKEAGRKAVLMAGDLADPAHCRPGRARGAGIRAHRRAGE